MTELHCVIAVYDWVWYRRLRRFQCEFDNCGKKFKFKHHLKEHMRIHTGTCDYSSSFCSSLRIIVKLLFLQTLALLKGKVA